MNRLVKTMNTGEKKESWGCKIMIYAYALFGMCIIFQQKDEKKQKKNKSPARRMNYMVSQ